LRYPRSFGKLFWASYAGCIAEMSSAKPWIN
jgi:hypothetical protein